MNPIAVIYHLEPQHGCFNEYQRLWDTMLSFLQQRGAIGSVLHQAEDNTVVIYSRWPDLECYQASWPKEEDMETELPAEMYRVSLNMKACIKEVLNTQILHIAQDKLL